MQLEIPVGETLNISHILAAIDAGVLDRVGHEMWATEFGRAQLRVMAVAAGVEGMPLEEILQVLAELVEGTSTQFPD